MVTRTQVLGGRYVLGEVLGTGGMATVWRAADEVLGREVAVKVLSPQYAADAGFVARFEREARHAARLSHPRLVTVFDCGIDNGTAFIVMELVAGRTLRQVLGEAGIVPPAQAAGIAAAVCEGLEVAHAAGLVHRDIKPANIVVSGGEVKVLDFGIVRAEGPAGLTRTQAVLGTAAYLSPEQASGRPAGPQSDLYSLGCVLFEMLTGEPPFTADSAVGLAYRHVHDDPGPPSARRPGAGGQLDEITAWLLAKDPAARPPGAAAARAGLLAALNPAATAVLPGLQEDGVPSGRRWCSRAHWRPCWWLWRRCCSVARPPAPRRVRHRTSRRPPPLIIHPRLTRLRTRRTSRPSAPRRGAPAPCPLSLRRPPRSWGSWRQGSPMGRSPRRQAKTCTTTSSNSCSARPAISRSASSNTRSSCSPLTSAVSKGRSPATPPSCCATPCRPWPPLSAAVNRNVLAVPAAKAGRQC